MVRARRLLLLGMALSCVSLFAQRVKTVSAEYTYYAPETMSVEEAKRIALDRAKIQAIADEFGTIVSQSNSTVVSNVSGDSDIKFHSIGSSDIKGEWLETIGNPKFEIYYRDNLLAVNVRVKGKIREMEGANDEVVVETLRNGLERRHQSSDFRADDEFYLYFQSSRSGYISIWLSDYSSDVVYRLIPYQRASEALYAVEANREYIFFSPEKSSASEYNIVDEVVMSTENDVDFNDLFVVFSPRTYNVPPTTSRDGLRYATTEKFDNWLANLRSKNHDVILNKTTLNIRK